MSITETIIDSILSEDGWVIIRDREGRCGQRLVEAERISPDGVLLCVAELREKIVRKYDSKRDFWTSEPTSEWAAPYLRPCFAPEVIA